MQNSKLARVGSLATAAALLAAMTAPAFADDSSFPVVNQTAANANATFSINPNTSQIIPADGSQSEGAGAGKAGSGMKGAAGFNAASGSGNQQDNTIVLINSTASASQGPTEGQAFTTQTSGSLSTPNGGNTVAQGGSASSTIGGSTASFASGNIGANSAAGDLNQQANVLVLTNKPTGYANFSAAVAANSQTLGYGQTIQAPLSDTGTGPAFNATINGSAGASSQGNVGFNSASGAMNQQANSLYASTASSGSTPNRTNAGVLSNTAPYQVNFADTANQFFASNSSTIGASAAQGAGGNTALNSAAGSMNQQSNGTILITGISGAGGASTPGAGVRSTQYTEYGTASEFDTPSAGTINGHAGESASGALSMNSVGGLQNQQSNATIVLNGVNGQPTSSRACTQCGANLQEGYGNQFLSATGPAGTNSGDIRGNAVAGASGLTALNAGGGLQNQQSNLEILFNGSGKVTDGAPQGVTQYGIGAGAATSQDVGENESSIAGNAGKGATGAVNANATGGNGNQQMNQMLVLTGDQPFAQPSNASTQLSSGQNVKVYDGKSDATLGGNAFASSQGAVNASVSAGDLNQQGNVMLLQTSNLTDTIPSASQSISSIRITSNSNGGGSGGPTTATLGGSAFAGASGALNANVASGIGGQQANIMQVTH